MRTWGVPPGWWATTYCSYLLPKQAGGSAQIFIFKTLRMMGRPTAQMKSEQKGGEKGCRKIPKSCGCLKWKTPLPVERILRPLVENIVLVVLIRTLDGQAWIEVGRSYGHLDRIQRLPGSAEAPPVDAGIHVGNVRVEIFSKKVRVWASPSRFRVPANC